MKSAFRHLGAKSSDLLVPPAKGFDNGVLKLGGGRVLVFTADPISYIPSLGADGSAWLSVHHLASDLATSGVAARYAVVDYNLPGDMADRTIRAYLDSFGDRCQELGITIVGGHTGRYPGCGLTIAGAGFMFAEAKETGFVTPAMAMQGDRVLVTKGPALEAAAVLAYSFPSKVSEAFGPSILGRARRRLGQCSVVGEAMAAASIGLRDDGVTAMHDATEGGVVEALAELAAASGKELAVDLSLLRVQEDVAKVCSLFGLNPMETLSEGTLVIACRPGKANRLKKTLALIGIESFEIGEVRQGALAALQRDELLKLSSARLPGEKYWDVYAKGIEEGWS
jgi:hydrogenase maturation factor